MKFEQLCEKLRPFYGEKMDRLRYAYLAAKPPQRGMLEARLARLYDEKCGNDEILLEPPPLRLAVGEYPLGTVCYGRHHLGSFGLREQEWIQHVAVFGRSGAGKTNFVLLILWNFLKHAKPFMVFDWKRNYRDFLRVHGTEGVLLFTVGRSVRPFTFNPWIPPPGTDTKIWVKKIIEVLCHAYFAGEGVMDVLLRSADQAYRDIEHPVSQEVLLYVEKVKETARQALWKASSLRILRALCYGGMGDVTKTRSNAHVEELLQRQVILELDALSDADKTFLIEALLLWIHHYRLSAGQRERFRHALIVEEAHHILLKRKHEDGEEVTDVILREIRELGEAVILVDQHPSLISLPAIGNTYTTVVFNLKAHEDVDATGRSILLEFLQRDVLGRLEVGQAVAKLQGRYLKPFLISTPKIWLPKGSVTDDELRAGEVEKRVRLSVQGIDYELAQAGPVLVKVPPLLSDWLPCSASSPEKTTSIRREEEVLLADKMKVLGERERLMLQSVVDEPLLTTLQRYEKLALSRYQGNEAKQKLIDLGFVDPVTIITKQGRVVLLDLTKQAKLLLGAPHTSLEHRFWVDRVARQLTAAGYHVAVETPVGGYAPDIFAQKDGETTIVEVETGMSDFLGNYENGKKLKPTKIYILATTLEAKRKIAQPLLAGACTLIRLARDFAP